MSDVETDTTTLVGFLLARIAEDEAVAQAAGHGCGYLHNHNAGWLEVILPDEHNARPIYDVRYIENFSPERVLAECEAKRRIVEHHRVAHDEHHHVREHSVDGYGEGYDEGGGSWCPTLRFLALPYADHPDFRAEWRP